MIDYEEDCRGFLMYQRELLENIAKKKKIMTPEQISELLENQEEIEEMVMIEEDFGNVIPEEINDEIMELDKMMGELIDKVELMELLMDQDSIDVSGMSDGEIEELNKKLALAHELREGWRRRSLRSRSYNEEAREFCRIENQEHIKTLMENVRKKMDDIDDEYKKEHDRIKVTAKNKHPKANERDVIEKWKSGPGLEMLTKKIAYESKWKRLEAELKGHDIQRGPEWLEVQNKIDQYEGRHRTYSQLYRVGLTIKELVTESKKTGQSLEKVFIRVARMQNAAHDLQTEHEWLKEIHDTIVSEPHDPPLSDDQFKKLRQDVEEVVGIKISLPARNRYFLGLYIQTRQKQRERAASRLLPDLE